MQFKMVDSNRFVGLLVHLRMRLSHQKFNAHKVNTSCIIIQRNVLTLNQTRRSKLKNKYIYKKSSHIFIRLNYLLTDNVFMLT